MPYDKGDFTQQGVDGKVAGGLLLNNKRDVDVLVSTNEDDSTLDLFAVTVEDHLNDLHYTVRGKNLEAGEVYEIGAGSSGLFETVELKVNLPDGFGYDLIAPIFSAEDVNIVSASGGEEATQSFNIVIPTNGNTIIEIKPTWAGGEVVIVSGDITNLESTFYSITGNAEVTVQETE